MPREEADILIAGGGAVGLAQAAALADALGPDASIVVLDRQALVETTEDGAGDPRAFAISAASRQLLSAVGAWDDLAPHAQAVLAIDITDSSLDDAFRPPLLAYDNTVADGEPATTILGEARLRDSLLKAVRRRTSVRLQGKAAITALTVDPACASITTADGAVYSAPLVIAADGRGSPVRRAAGIKTVDWDYGQIGIVTAVRLARPHGGRAVQHFLPAGPFAILPLPDNRACITWTEEARRGEEILALDDARFRGELERRFGTRLGAFEIDGRRLSWPLRLHLARSFVAPRVALAGDAAHGVHPLAGQGLNLGLRDVAALAEVLADAARLGLDIGAIDTLERYERWRRPDCAMSAMAYDALNRLFSNNWHVLRTARDAGLGLVDRLPGLKQLLVAEAAGLTGDVPKLLRGLSA